MDVSGGRDAAGGGLVYVPTSALHPSSWNPRLAYVSRFYQLIEMIRADPSFLQARPILAMNDGTIYAGNQRYRALCQLYRDGWESPLWATGLVPAILHDITEAEAKARALRDNNHAGEWQEVELAERLLEIAAADGSTLPTLGFRDDELRNIMAAAGVGEYVDPITGRLLHPEAVHNAPQTPQEPRNDGTGPGVGGGTGEPLTIVLRFATTVGWDHARWALGRDQLRGMIGHERVMMAYDGQGRRQGGGNG